MCVFCLDRCWYLDREIFDIYLLLLVMLVAKAHTQKRSSFLRNTNKKMADENKKERSVPGAAAGAAALTSANTSATTAKDEFQRVVSQHDKHAGRLMDLGK